MMNEESVNEGSENMHLAEINIIMGQARTFLLRKFHAFL